MAQDPKIDESQLVNLLQSKKREGFNYLYDNYANALYAVIFKVVGKEEITNDLLQEVFVKIWNNVVSYDTSKGRLYTWMLNIARNRAIDYLRSKAHNKTKQTNSIDENVYAVDQVNSTSIYTDAIGLKETVAKLPKKLHDVIVLIYFKGFTQDEASKALDIPLGTVKTRSRSAIKKLRELLDD